jgi:hypothetical protein
MTSFVAAVEDAERAQLIVDLKVARRELVARGRCRGTLLDRSTGAVCAMGAVSVATIEGFDQLATSDDWCSAQSASARFLRAERQLSRYAPNGSVETFNDSPATIDQDVLDLFDKTLANLGGLA